MLKKTFMMIAVVCILLLPALSAQAAEARESGSADTHITDSDHEKPHHSIGHVLLMYIPNRIFDVFDILRVHARIGPGIAAGVRVTKPLEVFVGAYKALWVGIHGPRTKPKVPWPIGVEGQQGVDLILVGDVDETKYGPHYQFDEIAVDAQVLVVGASVGVSIAEIFDLATGLLFIDISGDDL